MLTKNGSCANNAGFGWEGHKFSYINWCVNAIILYVIAELSRHHENLSFKFSFDVIYIAVNIISPCHRSVHFAHHFF